MQRRLFGFRCIIKKLLALSALFPSFAAVGQGCRYTISCHCYGFFLAWLPCTVAALCVVMIPVWYAFYLPDEYALQVCIFLLRTPLR